MPINAEYRGPGELPEIIPVFPLPGALLLPRGQMPLNIFEPRYLAMVDDALRDGHRLIGMIQPDISHSKDEAKPELFRVGCVGRITQLAESGDGRYILELTGVARFKVVEEISTLTAYRQCKVDFFPYADDFTARKGEDAVDREALLEVLTDFLNANNLKVDWEGIESAPNEALVNALAMMSPYGPAEKQAMLEAPDLKTRAEILIAVTEMDLAKKRTSGEPGLQKPKLSTIPSRRSFSEGGSALCLRGRCGTEQLRRRRQFAYLPAHILSGFGREAIVETGV